MEPKDRVLYIATQDSSFVSKDINLLRRHFSVQKSFFSGKGLLQILKSFLLQLLFLIRWGRKAKAILVMFGGYHALLPTIFAKVFRKRIFIILGGTDCVSFPSIGYGTFRKPLQGKVACFVFRYATGLLPVHQSLLFREDTYYNLDSKYQGCQYWCKTLSTPSRTIHNGYEPEEWNIHAALKGPRTFVTIASITDSSKLILKGIDIILKAAQQLPDCRFVIIGLSNKVEVERDLPNVIFKPFLSHDEIRLELEKAKFYLQLSISEGFPNALCESMLAECIPICSPVAAMPEIIGDTGFILEKRDPQELVRLIQNCIDDNLPPTLGRQAREKVITDYSVKKREMSLKEVCSLAEWGS